MKRPEYVALMTSLYRKAIDAYYEKKEFHVDKEMKEEMQKIFHRGFNKRTSVSSDGKCINESCKTKSYRNRNWYCGKCT